VASKELDAIHAARKHFALKTKVLEAYGGKCECGVDDLILLTVDHVLDDGHEHRRQLGKGATGYGLYRDLVRNGFPDIVQCMCWNCQIRKLRKMLRREDESTLTRAGRSFRKLKREVMAAYGNVCSICETNDLNVMTLDHTNGGGKAHRRISTPIAYIHARRDGFPPEYRLLCANCNAREGFKRLVRKYGDLWPKHRTAAPVPECGGETAADSLD
jgi:hypothetical protein